MLDMFGTKKTPHPSSPEASAQGQVPIDAASETPLFESETDASTTEEAAPAEAEGSSRIGELEGEIARLKDQMLRTAAEAENTRRRMEREMDDARKYAVSVFARDLLAVADNLRRAIEALTPEQRDSSPAMKNLLVGIEATEKQLIAGFEKHGVQLVDAMGQAFDPNFHQAMQEIEDASVPAGTVVQVFQKGYTIADRLLRPALVVVAKAPAGNAVDTQA